MTRYKRDPKTWELVEVEDAAAADDSSDAAVDSSDAAVDSSDAAEAEEGASGATRPPQEGVSDGADGASRGSPDSPSPTPAPHEPGGEEIGSDPETGRQPNADETAGGGESAPPLDQTPAEATAAAADEPLLGLDPADAPELTEDDLDPVQVPELHEVDCPDDLREEIEALMARYPQKRSASIPALWAIQRRYGWCTPEGMRQIAAVMQITPAYLESVASFYDLLRLSPIGEQRVLVCTNISCWMRGADQLLESFCEAAGVDAHEAGHGGATSDDGKLFISGFECLGACDIAPMASINERYFGPLENADAKTAVDELLAGSDPLPNKALAKRPAAGGDPEPDPRVAG